LDDAPEITDGQRIAISEPLIQHLLSYLHSDLSPHLRAGHVGQLKFQEYGAKSGSTWIERHLGIYLQLPVEWTDTQKIAGATAMISHKGKPVVFITQRFLNHLKYVGAETYDWELVL
jgi:aspartyl aminopeptidase